MGVQDMKLKAIADAIRTKEDSVGEIPANEFASRILALETGGGMPEGLHTINVSASDVSGGSVAGGGISSSGMTVTVSATPADTYEFNGWTENGTTVSEDEQYTFQVNTDRSLVAGFAVPQYVVGRDWWESTLPSSGVWRVCTYGDGKFIAILGSIASGSTTGAYSENGINWTKITLPISLKWSSIAYGNGKFVVTAYDNGKTIYSIDGKNWTSGSITSSTAPFSAIAFGNGKFVAVGSTPSVASNWSAYSENGTSWTIKYLPVSKTWASIAYGDGKFVIISKGDTVVLFSEDGITWEQTELPVKASWNAVTYGNGKFVAVAGNAGSTTAAYSEDGINWISVTLPIAANWYNVAFGDGTFVATGDGTNVLYSKDGVNWISSAFPTSSYWQGVAFGNGKFIATSNAGKVAYSSSKGPGV